MSPPLSDSDAADYMTTVLNLYLGLPETPLRTLRRLLRPQDLPPLSPVRSLAYFLPVIEELLANPAPDSYLEYLRSKLRRFPSRKTAPTAHTPAVGQKNTFSDGR